MSDAANHLFPDGVTHDGTFICLPFPVYITRADGSKKWGLDDKTILLTIGRGHGGPTPRT